MNHTILNCALMVCGLICTSNYAQEQETIDKGPSHSVSLHTLQTTVEKLKVSYDRRIGDSRNWILLSPSVSYSSSDDFWNYSYNKRSGIGLDISHRYYLLEKKKFKSIYIQYGAVYNYSNVEANRIGWVPTTFEGTNALKPGRELAKYNLHQIGTDFLFGVQLLSWSGVLFDFHAGMGIRTSLSKKNKELLSMPGYGILNPGYSGILPLIGIRIGYAF